MGCGVTKLSTVDPIECKEQNAKKVVNLESNKQQSTRKWLGPDDTITERANYSGDFGNEIDNSPDSQNTSQSEGHINVHMCNMQKPEIVSLDKQENSNYLLTYNSNFTTPSKDLFGRAISPEYPFTINFHFVSSQSARRPSVRNIESLSNKISANEVENESDSYSIRPRSQSYHLLSCRRTTNRPTPEELVLLSDNETNEIDISSSLVESNPILGIRGTGDNNFDASGLSLD